jgi:hypothetical protein
MVQIYLNTLSKVQETGPVFSSSRLDLGSRELETVRSCVSQFNLRGLLAL